jgi:hypothetical protein
VLHVNRSDKVGGLEQLRMSGEEAFLDPGCVVCVHTLRIILGDQEEAPHHVGDATYRISYILVT